MLRAWSGHGAHSLVVRARWRELAGLDTRPRSEKGTGTQASESQDPKVSVIRTQASSRFQSRVSNLSEEPLGFEWGIVSGKTLFHYACTHTHTHVRVHTHMHTYTHTCRYHNSSVLLQIWGVCVRFCLKKG